MDTSTSITLRRQKIDNTSTMYFLIFIYSFISIEMDTWTCIQIDIYMSMKINEYMKIKKEQI